MHLVRVNLGFMNSTYLKFAEDSRFQFVQSRGLVVNFRIAIYKCFSLNFSFEYDNEGGIIFNLQKFQKFVAL